MGIGFLHPPSKLSFIRGIFDIVSSSFRSHVFAKCLPQIPAIHIYNILTKTSEIIEDDDFWGHLKLSGVQCYF